MLAAAGVIIAILVFGLGFGLFVWFILTIRSAVSLVAEEEQRFAPWTLWLLLVPFFNYIVAWYLLPFHIPKTLAAGTSSRRAKVATKRFFHIGLAIQLLPILASFIPLGAIGQIVFVVVWVLLILTYWVNIYQFKKRFLMSSKGRRKGQSHGESKSQHKS